MCLVPSWEGYDILVLGGVTLLSPHPANTWGGTKEIWSNIFTRVSHWFQESHYQWQVFYHHPHLCFCGSLMEKGEVFPSPSLRHLPIHSALNVSDSDTLIPWCTAIHHYHGFGGQQAQQKQRSFRQETHSGRQLFRSLLTLIVTLVIQGKWSGGRSKSCCCLHSQSSPLRCKAMHK